VPEVKFAAAKGELPAWAAPEARPEDTVALSQETQFENGWFKPEKARKT
jgi:hypothetical protein